MNLLWTAQKLHVEFNRSEAGLVALPCTEIISETDFFDYEAKYLGKSKEITPARISAELTASIQEQAKKIYSVLQLRSIARIDFIIIGQCTPCY